MNALRRALEALRSPASKDMLRLILMWAIIMVGVYAIRGCDHETGVSPSNVETQRFANDHVFTKQ